MLITWVTTVSSSGRHDNVGIKISRGIVVKMTIKIFTVEERRRDYVPLEADHVHNEIRR